MSLYGNLEYMHVEIFEELLKKYGKGIVLDLGCGPEFSAKYTSKLVGTLIQMDCSEGARENYFANRELPKNSYFVTGDVRQMPLKNETADIALMLGIFGTCIGNITSQNYLYASLCRNQFLFENQEHFLRETSRVLKLEGIVIVSNSIERQPIEETKEQFQEYFKILNIHEGQKRYLMECRKNP